MSGLLKRCKVMNHSGITVPGSVIKTIKEHQFKKLKRTVSGDAPKDVLRIYEYGESLKKENYKTWPIYIVKVGQKWYPNESITEQLITDIGKQIRVNIASSKLFEIEGVIRFGSKHFHKDTQILNHGATILSHYFNKSKDWIDDLENNDRIKELIDVNDVVSAIKHEFGSDCESITSDFLDLLLYDCFVGNNDRHYYNWGVITDISEQQSPYFSPIYDTARGLWWNYSDKYIVNLLEDKNSTIAKVKSYISKSLPKIVTPNNNKCNHFELISYLLNHDYLTTNHLLFWKNKSNLMNAISVIDDKYKSLMIPERRKIIKKTLRMRFQKMVEILSS